MITNYRITIYWADDNYVSRSMNEIHHLVTKLWQYNYDLGVEAYEADTDDLEGTLKWELQGNWYTTSQIERIMKLRAFL